jgi:class 3 adenylate cyclase
VDQRIAFCSTTDGVSIAYATLDEGGPHVLYVAGFPTQLEEEWQRPTSRQFLATLATGLTLIRYDMRGCGLSDREVEDVSVRSLVRDLEAVADATGYATFALLGLGMLAGPVAITYAATHPERVTQLVLCSAFTNGKRLATPEQQQTLIEYTERFGFPVLEYAESPDPTLQLDRTGRDVVHLAATPALVAALLREFYGLDVTHLIERVTAPAVILHGQSDRLVPFAEGRRLAAALPQAEFVPIEGNTGAALTEQNATLPAIRRALGARPTAAASADAALATVVFTDVVGHTQIMQRLGDEQGRAVLREHEQITRGVLRRHSGVEVKAMGDGFMASFASVTKALEAAVALQRAFAERNEGAEEAIHVRIGLSAGEPIAEEGDLFGSTVILASRIAAQAGAGEILVPDTVRGLASGKGFLFADRGEVIPKGFEEPVRLYELRWRE